MKTWWTVVPASLHDDFQRFLDTGEASETLFELMKADPDVVAVIDEILREVDNLRDISNQLRKLVELVASLPRDARLETLEKSKSRVTGPYQVEICALLDALKANFGGA